MSPLSAILASLLVANGAFAAPAVIARETPSGFDPNSYQKQFVQCNAVERSGLTPQNITLKLGYLDINPTAKKTIVMVHGWPSLWTTYRNQIEAFGSEYRLIIPENRGYGDSEHPKDLYSSNTMGDFVNDIECMMDNAGVASGVCMGNDFGAQVCWEAGLLSPNRFKGVFNVGVPFISSAREFKTNEQFSQVAPNLGYTFYLSNNATGASKEMDADPRSAIRACAQIAATVPPHDFLSSKTSFLEPWNEWEKENNVTTIPFSGIMSQEVEDYMVESYQKQGFFNTYNGYQANNRLETYLNQKKLGKTSLSQPAFVLFPTRDPVANWHDWSLQEESYKYLANFYNATTPSAHWAHEELPEEFNLHFTQWIGNVTFDA
ncbi:uncharacterized protein BP5553_08899 [Venustampulla echinocandica]|uniref:AB hydrolase-1 domain-containing protein n=1 Tax=Venustampulla echinocandica TaxID=2656787 RepID=A0A370TD96_9HELO|nr:uncharacterized protein BP5553_08899 [Venustampulla echinocandica]RDL32443.1 hypothetical protein BP5553_08899 [Venustampulla echinocandica]